MPKNAIFSLKNPNFFCKIEFSGYATEFSSWKFHKRHNNGGANEMAPSTTYIKLPLALSPQTLHRASVRIILKIKPFKRSRPSTELTQRYSSSSSPGHPRHFLAQLAIRDAWAESTKPTLCATPLCHIRLQHRANSHASFRNFLCLRHTNSNKIKEETNMPR